MRCDIRAKAFPKSLVRTREITSSAYDGCATIIECMWNGWRDFGFGKNTIGRDSRPLLSRTRGPGLDQNRTTRVILKSDSERHGGGELKGWTGRRKIRTRSPLETMSRDGCPEPRCDAGDLRSFSSASLRRDSVQSCRPRPDAGEPVRCRLSRGGNEPRR